MALLVAATGCIDHVDLGSDSLPGLVSIEVTPAEQTLAIALPSSPQLVAYSAVGHFSDGATRDITAELAWSTDNPAPGSFSVPGTYTSSNAAGGHVAIRAAHDDIAATAALTVAISSTIVDDSFPPPTSDLFGSGAQVVTDMMKSPSVAYPADATMFPQELAPALFQYVHSPMTDAYRLSFTSDVLALTIITGSDRWRPDPDVWALIERSHLGATATFEVDATTSTSPTTIYAGAPITIAFAPDSPGGAVYFTAKMKQGVLRGMLGSSTATKVYPPPGDNTPTDNEMVSLDGQTMAVAYMDHLRTIDVATSTVLATPNVPMGWAAVSPDGTLVVVANMGMLSIYDTLTGIGIGSPDGHIGLPGRMATHPDWSPDGTHLAVVFGNGVTNDDLKGGSIATLAYLGAGAWGPPQIVVTSTGDNDNNYFPKWSPDGGYLAYVHADGPAKDAPTAELRLVAAGGGAPIALQRASQQMLADTMPAWAPGPRPWLAFASTRPYGIVRPMTGSSQIWITAIDLAAAGDPSSSAFWMPAQDISGTNTTPSWPPNVTTTAATRSTLSR
ncbi:MAG: hypothetical protein ABI591_25710 [Kofleriaceae bacterium]